MRSFIVLVLSLFVSTAALAQHDHAAAPPSPVMLDDGLSDLHWKVSTSNAEAQKFFDQGMRYLYAFNHEQAVRSFQHATELDPDLAMGYWGAALALGPNINLDVDPPREQQAYDAVHAAAAHQEHASPMERDLIAALLKRYSKEPTVDLRKLAIDYSDAMRETARSADVVTFTSSSTVTNYLEAVGFDAVPGVVACIGPVTADTARRQGLHVDIEAVEHTVDGLVDALVAHLGQQLPDP